MAHRWYIVHAYSNFEKKVAETIREQAVIQGLADKISEVLVPTEEVVEVRRGHKVNTQAGDLLQRIHGGDIVWVCQGHSQRSVLAEQRHGHTTTRHVQRHERKNGLVHRNAAEIDRARAGLAAQEIGQRFRRNET